MNVGPDSSVEDLLERFPFLTRVFVRFNLPCLVCGEPFWGTIRELAEKHGTDLEALVDALNRELEREP